MIAEDVNDVAEHQRRLADPDRYRPAACPRCGHARLHVHCRPERRPRGDPLLPVALLVLQFRCAHEECGATWRVLPRFLARHVWHVWRAVERIVRPPIAPTPLGPSIAAPTQRRWLARLASSARVLVAVLATTVNVGLAELAMSVGLGSTRRALVDAYIGITTTPRSDPLSSLAALVHRLEPGLRLM